MSVYDLLTQVGLTSVTDADWNGGREKCFSFVTDDGDKKVQDSNHSIVRRFLN